MNLPADLAEALLEAPLGVATLARLEWRAVGAEMSGFEAPASTPAGVDAAVALVHSMRLSELIELVLWAETTDVGPWIGDASEQAASAYRRAEARRPIAEAVAERFGHDLHESVDCSTQQWWTTAIGPSPAWRRSVDIDVALFGDFEEVYGAGQFTFGGLWTITDPPAALHEGLADVWEMYPGSIVRWRLPVRPDARVFEIHRRRLGASGPRAPDACAPRPGRLGAARHDRIRRGPSDPCPSSSSRCPASTRRSAPSAGTWCPTGRRWLAIGTACTCRGRGCSPPRVSCRTSSVRSASAVSTSVTMW